MSSTPSIEEIWQRYDATEQRLTMPLSERMLELAQIGEAMSVLDLATGRGEPAIEAARRVGPTGQVVGIDLSQPMLDMTRDRARQAGLDNLELIVGDACDLSVMPALDFDVVLSRWGLMYMLQPVAALSAAKSRCRPGAKLVAALWAEPERVDYLHVPSKLLEHYMPLPAVVPEQPGTFRYASPDVITRDLAAAGWRTVAIEEMYIEVMEASTAEELVHWCQCFGMNRLMQGLPDESKAAWRNDLMAQFPQLVNRQGQVRLGGVTRLVVAHAS